MKIALLELKRRPSRFVAAAAILTALAILLMFLGGLLDGLVASSTGAYRAQRADLVVYSADSRDSLTRSRIDPETRATVEQAAAGAEVGGLGITQLGARRGDEPDSRDLIATAVAGYELAPRGLPGDPPGPGEVVADDTVTSSGVEVGDVLLLGPARTPVTVVGLVDDTEFSGQATLWSSLDTWRDVTAANRPDQAFADASVQALVVRTPDPAGDVAATIDDASAGSTNTLTLAAAIDAVPGVEQQRATFTQIIAVTALIAAVVVALFFALITVERIGLYGVLKAVGASSGTLFAGVAAQALSLAALASLVGAAAALAMDATIPAGSIPFQITVGRLALSAGLLLLAAVVGCGLSLRRILRVDPAAAIGAAP